jgi:hypothetical protein
MSLSPSRLKTGERPRGNDRGPLRGPWGQALQAPWGQT